LTLKTANMTIFRIMTSYPTPAPRRGGCYQLWSGTYWGAAFVG